MKHEAQSGNVSSV